MEAVYWYMKAAAQNNAKAKQMLETIQTKHSINEEDIEKARKWVQSESKSADQKKP